MPLIPASPYAAVLGDRMTALHPRLRTYFQTIPPGMVGVGAGVFDTVGSPRPILRRLIQPLFRILERRGAVHTGWAQNVPFTVRNRAGSGPGTVEAPTSSVLAEREFHFPGGSWIMRDAVHATAQGRIVDRLGSPAILAAVFDVDVEEGALLLRSTRIDLRVGPLRVRAPRILTPSIRLRESFDDAQDRQRVALTVDMPLIGRIYEYTGTFQYRIEEQK